MNLAPAKNSIINFDVDVVESIENYRDDKNVCDLNRDIRFDSQSLETYCFAPWDPIIYDLMLVIATVEYCDHRKKRSSIYWPRNFCLKIPVHEPNRWRGPSVCNTLSDTLNFLTGDQWRFDFISRQKSFPEPRQLYLGLKPNGLCVMAYSEGLDSRSMAEIVRAENGSDTLVRVRIGDKGSDVAERNAFAAIPFKVQKPHSGESSFRSRGFKFAAISGLAAYLANISRVVVPESGQGVIAPVLIPLRAIYQDYRNHPIFFRKMEKFLQALLGHKIEYQQPRLWFTKGETILYALEKGAQKEALLKTRSCWKKRQHVAFSGMRHQCGLCAACMLRRMSLHHANLTEASSTYSWEDLNKATFWEAAPNELKSSRLESMQRDAFAGVSHLNDFAAFAKNKGKTVTLDSHSLEIARALDSEQKEVRQNLDGLIERHALQWDSFLSSLDKGSFIKEWARRR
ncbi:MAG: 7-cyano-7-deazaguanine synthase [Candidatus Melainabacteria bacterium]|nr:7-cyano-7-deazaguanine synthase [Candidatus Melainabacteria bacterium]